MGNGDDALLVPDRRKSRINEAGQFTGARLRPPAVQRDHSGVAEIADAKGLSAGRRERDTKAAVPYQAGSARQLNWSIRTGEFTQHKNAVTPTHEAATAERVSLAQSAGENPAQTGNPLASGRIRLAANGSNNRLQRPPGNVRWSKGESGINNSEPCGMQNHRQGETSIGFALARRPLVPELANVAGQR